MGSVDLGSRDGSPLSIDWMFGFDLDRVRIEIAPTLSVVSSCDEGWHGGCWGYREDLL